MQDKPGFKQARGEQIAIERERKPDVKPPRPARQRAPQPGRTLSTGNVKPIKK